MGDWEDIEDLYELYTPSYYEKNEEFRRRNMPKNTKNQKNKINKFYVGAGHIADKIEKGINDSWTHLTLEAAIRHARQILEDEDKDCIIVVEIKALIKRKKNPVEVKKI